MCRLNLRGITNVFLSDKLFDEHSQCGPRHMQMSSQRAWGDEVGGCDWMLKRYLWERRKCCWFPKVRINKSVSRYLSSRQHLSHHCTPSSFQFIYLINIGDTLGGITIGLNQSIYFGKLVTLDWHNLPKYIYCVNSFVVFCDTTKNFSDVNYYHVSPSAYSRFFMVFFRFLLS
jgi:hypothetical protein